MKGIWSIKTAAVATMLALAAWPVAIGMIGLTAAAAPDKATGSGYWTNGGGLGFYAEFNAHVATDMQPAKGYLLQELVDDTGGFTVNVNAVDVYDGYACFGGNTATAWGAYAAYLNDYRWTVVVDGGEPAMDYLRGGWTGGATSPPSWCSPPDTGGNQMFSGGNIQVHYGG